MGHEGLRNFTVNRRTNDNKISLKLFYALNKFSKGISYEYSCVQFSFHIELIFVNHYDCHTKIHVGYT